MGGCTPAKLTGSDIMADIPDMVCPTVGGAALEDFISCDANARILKSSHSHNQYWQFPNPKMIAKKFIGSSAASYEASDGQFYGKHSTNLRL